MKTLSTFFLFVLLIGVGYSQGREIIYLWTDKVPNQSEAKAEAVVSDDKKGNVTRIEKVSNPALVVYEANPKRKNGAAVIICPGGGYSILAIDKEGYEVAEWLSQLGYTAFVLQYRVPNDELGALQDVQRAIRYVRGVSKGRGIKSDQIGVMGFSAGGSLSARASTRYLETMYEPVDKWDDLSARPDFSALIYPAYLDRGVGNSLTPELKINKKTPPMFIFVAADDKYANSSLVMGSARREHKVPFELHVLPEGGHGYGLRAGRRAAKTWPILCEKWLKLTVFK